MRIEPFVMRTLMSASVKATLKNATSSKSRYNIVPIDLKKFAPYRSP